MKISCGVQYQSFGGKVFVRNEETRREYILAGSAAEILDYVASKANPSAPELLKFFSEKYSAEVQREISELVDEMLGEEILTEVGKYFPPAEISSWQCTPRKLSSR